MINNPSEVINEIVSSVDPNSLDQQFIDDLCKTVEKIIEKENNKHVVEEVNETSEETINRFLQEFKQIFEDFHGEDNIDFQVDYISKFEGSVSILIRYPEIEVNNSSGEKHLIRDLFLRIRFDYSINKDTNKLHYSRGYQGLKGYRTTRTAQEVISGYTFSHLPSESSRSFSSFCLGSGTPISNLMTFFSTIPVYDEEFSLHINRFLFILDAYVRWESLEGGPYKTIKCVETETLKLLSNYNNSKAPHLSTFIVYTIITQPEFYEYFNNNCFFRGTKDIYINENEMIILLSKVLEKYNKLISPEFTVKFNTNLKTVVEKLDRISIINEKADSIITSLNPLSVIFKGDVYSPRIIKMEKIENSEENHNIINTFTPTIIEDVIKIILKLYYNT